MNNLERVKKYSKLFGLEDEDFKPEIIADEVEMNEEYDYEDDPFNIGIIEPDEEENPSDNISETLEKDDARAVNLIDMTATHINKYHEDMGKVMTKIVLERTGNFSSSEWISKFVYPAIEIVDKCYPKDEVKAKLLELGNLLEDRSIMTKLAGNEAHPFIYEGLQLVFYVGMTGALAMIGPSLKLGGSLEETAKHIQFKSFKDVIEMLDTIKEVKNSLGNKIYYVENTVELENNDAASIYVEIPSIATVDNGVTLATPAGESIANLIEIRNNGALFDFTTIMKVLERVAEIAGKVDLADLMTKALVSANNILSLDNTSEEGEDKFEALVEEARETIINVLDGHEVCTDDIDEFNVGTESVSDVWRSFISKLSSTSASLNFTGNFGIVKWGVVVAAGLIIAKYAINGIADLFKSSLEKRKAKKLAELKEHVKYLPKLVSEEDAGKFYDDLTKVIKDANTKLKNQISENSPGINKLFKFMSGRDMKVNLKLLISKSEWLERFRNAEVNDLEPLYLPLVGIDNFPTEKNIKDVEKDMELVVYEEDDEYVNGFKSKYSDEVIFFPVGEDDYMDPVTNSGAIAADYLSDAFYYMCKPIGEFISTEMAKLGYNDLGIDVYIIPDYDNEYNVTNIANVPVIKSSTTTEVGTESVSEVWGTFVNKISSVKGVINNVIDTSSAGFKVVKIAALITAGYYITKHTLKGILKYFEYRDAKEKAKKLTERAKNNMPRFSTIEEAGKYYDDLKSVFEKANGAIRNAIVDKMPVINSICKAVTNKDIVVNLELLENKAEWIEKFNDAEYGESSPIFIKAKAFDNFPDEYQIEDIDDVVELVEIKYDKDDSTVIGVKNKDSQEITVFDPTKYSINNITNPEYLYKEFTDMTFSIGTLVEDYIKSEMLKLGYDKVDISIDLLQEEKESDFTNKVEVGVIKAHTASQVGTESIVGDFWDKVKGWLTPKHKSVPKYGSGSEGIRKANDDMLVVINQDLTENTYLELLHIGMDAAKAIREKYANLEKVYANTLVKTAKENNVELPKVKLYLLGSVYEMQKVIYQYSQRKDDKTKEFIAPAILYARIFESDDDMTNTEKYPNEETRALIARMYTEIAEDVITDLGNELMPKLKPFMVSGSEMTIRKFGNNIIINVISKDDVAFK